MLYLRLLLIYIIIEGLVCKTEGLVCKTISYYENQMCFSRVMKKSSDFGDTISLMCRVQWVFSQFLKISLKMGHFDSEPGNSRFRAFLERAFVILKILHSEPGSPHCIIISND